MSRIYDALRKAERDRGKPRVSRTAPPREAVPRLKGEMRLLAGMDDRFRRSLLNLRNAIDSAMRERASRVIMFTSAVEGEGKTTIAASFARILSLGESERILLVDCAVQNPQLHELFGVPNKRGVIEFLAGQAKLADILHPVNKGVLDLVTAGATADSDVVMPLFNSDRLPALIKEASEKYDFVVIDSSAILESPEAPVIGAQVDGIVMVVHAARTKREVIKRAMLMVEKQNGSFVGTVLNRKPYYIPEFIYRRV